MFPTKEEFINYGITDLSELTEEMLDSIESGQFKILAYTVDEELENINLKITAVPHGQLIIQEETLNIISDIRKVILTATVTGGSILKVIMSFDEGNTWCVCRNHVWENISIHDLSKVKEKGLTKEELSLIVQEDWTAKTKKNKIKFAYYMEIEETSDNLILDNISYETAKIATATPFMDKLNIKYSELTLEGRMKSLEVTNKINLAKLNFKANLLINSKKYGLKEMIVDTFTEDSLIHKIEEGSPKKSIQLSDEINLEAGKYAAIKISEIPDFIQIGVR